jgi:microsomal dipeptidase-like Zn-dependent dipeptidase
MAQAPVEGRLMITVFRKLFALSLGVALFKAGWPVLGAVAMTGAINAWLFDVIANRVRRNESVEVSEEVAGLHESAFVADLHADVCLWERDLMKRNKRGHVDLPRLREGNVALQFVTVPTKLVLTKRAPRLFLSDLFFWGFFGLVLRPDRWSSSAARARWQFDNAARWIERAGGELLLLEDKAGLDALRMRRGEGEQVTGVMLGLEGAHALRGGLDVPWLAANGVRVLGITHFNDTRFGDSAHGWRKRGLTAAGRELVKELERHEITIDLAHASEAVIADCLKMYEAGDLKRPFLVTHTGIEGVHDHRRNITDEQAIEIARRGGLIGVTFFCPALPRLGVASVAETVVYLIELFDKAGLDGARHVAFGSDFDGAVTTVIDAAEWAQITAALLEAGLDEGQVRLVLGENVVAFFEKWLPEGAS